MTHIFYVLTNHILSSFGRCMRAVVVKVKDDPEPLDFFLFSLFITGKQKNKNHSELIVLHLRRIIVAIYSFDTNRLRFASKFVLIHLDPSFVICASYYAESKVKTFSQLIVYEKSFVCLFY